MRIDFHYGPHAASADSRAQEQNSVSNGSAVNCLRSVEDQTQLSGAHVQVSALAAQALQLPEIRQERIQALKMAVHSGQYHTDAQKVAVAMFADLISKPII